jgi:hypothetical protein
MIIYLRSFADKTHFQYIYLEGIKTNIDKIIFYIYANTTTFTSLYISRKCFPFLRNQQHIQDRS